MTESNQTRIIAADKIFTGSEWLTDHSVIIADDRVMDIMPSGKVSGPVTQCSLLAPAFFDIQIYGAYGRLLAVYPEPDSLHKLYAYCSLGGASHFQPTVATNDTTVFHQCIDAVRAYWNEGGKGCIGLHIEGPWINPVKKGAHQEDHIHPPSVAEARALLEYGKGVITMITLAPEVCSKEVIDLVNDYGVIISAGHSNATYEQATASFDAGIHAGTHLYNAMSNLQHRAPGMVGAIFDHPTLMCSLVPDGYHVDFAAIRIAKKIMKERLFVITDAVTETVLGPSQHHLVGERYECNGILSGSALTMAKSLHNLVNHVGIDLEEALRMVSLYPARVMGLSHRIGKIEKGFPSNIVLLDSSLQVMETISM